MVRFILGICILFGSFSLSIAQENLLPQWFHDDMKDNIGIWLADNSDYKSSEEPYDYYQIEWQYGIGNTSIIGALYGVTNGEKSNPFWQFRQYWDGENQQAMVLQFGNFGTMGLGYLKPVSLGYLESVQTFSLPDGSKWKEKHLTKMNENVLNTQSFEWKDDSWVKKRFYSWVKQTE